MSKASESDLVQYPHLYIGGEWVLPEDGGVIESLDPATGKPWAEVAYAGKRDTDRAVAAARTAFDLSLIHISEPTRLLSISYAVFCLKKKK